MNVRVEVWIAGRLMWVRSFPDLDTARSYAADFLPYSTRYRTERHALLVY